MVDEDLKDGPISFSYLMGLLYLEAYLSSSYAFLFGRWGQGGGLNELMVPSSQLALASKFADHMIKPMTWKLSRKWDVTQKVSGWSSSSKDSRHIQKWLRTSKFAPKEEGRYVFTKAYDSGYFLFSKLSSKDLLLPINAKWLTCSHI